MIIKIFLFFILKICRSFLCMKTNFFNNFFGFLEFRRLDIWKHFSTMTIGRRGTFLTKLDFQILKQIILRFVPTKANVKKLQIIPSILIIVSICFLHFILFYLLNNLSFTLWHNVKLPSQNLYIYIYDRTSLKEREQMEK